MAKKSNPKKSWREILATHPLPGLRIGRNDAGKTVLVFGRPGILSREVQPVVEKQPGTTERSQAEQEWLAGYEVLQGAPGNRAAALAHFEAALRLDSTMADAMLAIHLLDRASAPEMTGRMIENINRFGETREKFSLRLHSFYTPLLRAEERLESTDDLLRAGAGLHASVGHYEEARQLLARSGECVLSEISLSGLLYAEKRHAECLALLEGVLVEALPSPEISDAVKSDLLLVEGVCLNETGNRMEAIDVVSIAADVAPHVPLETGARYTLSMLLLENGSTEMAVTQLRMIESRDPGYGNVREMLGALDAENFPAGETTGAEPNEETEGPEEVERAEAGHFEDDFDQIVAAFNSGIVADDPSIADNRD